MRAFALPPFLLVFALAIPAFAEEGLPSRELTFEETVITGEAEAWPSFFEPMTALDPTVSGEPAAVAYAYRAAEYAIEANHLRLYATQAQWEGMVIFGESMVVKLYDGWAKTLDRATDRSRGLSVKHWLIEMSRLRLASIGR